MSHFDLRPFKAISDLSSRIYFRTLAAFDYFFFYFSLIIYPPAILPSSQNWKKARREWQFWLEEKLMIVWGRRRGSFQKLFFPFFRSTFHFFNKFNVFLEHFFFLFFSFYSAFRYVICIFLLFYFPFFFNFSQRFSYIFYPLSLRVFLLVFCHFSFWHIFICGFFHFFLQNCTGDLPGRTPTSSRRPPTWRFSCETSQCPANPSWYMDRTRVGAHPERRAHYDMGEIMKRKKFRTSFIGIGHYDTEKNDTKNVRRKNILQSGSQSAPSGLFPANPWCWRWPGQSAAIPVAAASRKGCKSPSAFSPSTIYPSASYRKTKFFFPKIKQEIRHAPLRLRVHLVQQYNHGGLVGRWIPISLVQKA